MFRNAFLIGLHYLFCTLVVFALHFVMFFLVVRIFAPLILFGEGIVALLSSYLLLNVFYLCSPTDDGEAEEQEESDSTEGENK